MNSCLSSNGVAVAVAMWCAGSAPGQSQFQRTLNYAPDIFSPDVAVWAEQTPDDGYVVLGAPADVALQSRVLKLDSSGALEWARDYASPVALVFEPSHIISAASGGYAFTGYLGGGGVNGTLLVRLDASGGVLWADQFLPAGFEIFFTRGPSVDEVEVASGGFVVSNQEAKLPALHRVGSGGGIWFSQRYRDVTVPPADAEGAFNDVHALSDGFVAVGWLGKPPVPGAAPVPQTLVVRTDLAGNVLWAKTYRQSQYNTAWGVDLAANGDFLISGYTKDAAEGGGTFLLRIDSVGTLIYEEWFLGVQGNRSIEELPGGNILLGSTVVNSTTMESAGALLTNAGGNYLAAWSWAGPAAAIDVGRCAMPTSDGGFIALGQTESFVVPTGRDLYLVKTDAATPVGTSGCFEQSFLPTQMPGVCLPHDEFLEIETGDPSTQTVDSIPTEMDSKLLCCPGDVSGDDTVDVLDLLAVLASWGMIGSPADVNGDGVVDILDLLAVLEAWGPCP